MTATTYAPSKGEKKDNNFFWLFIVAVSLVLLTAIYFNTKDLGIPCSYNPCELNATVYMKSEAGTVGAFCDPHSAEMYAQGWRIYP